MIRPVLNRRSFVTLAGAGTAAFRVSAKRPTR